MNSFTIRQKLILLSSFGVEDSVYRKAEAHANRRLDKFREDRKLPSIQVNKGHTELADSAEPLTPVHNQAFRGWCWLHAWATVGWYNFKAQVRALKIKDLDEESTKRFVDYLCKEFDSDSEIDFQIRMQALVVCCGKGENDSHEGSEIFKEHRKACENAYKYAFAKEPVPESAKGSFPDESEYPEYERSASCSKDAYRRLREDTFKEEWIRIYFWLSTMRLDFISVNDLESKHAFCLQSVDQASCCKRQLFAAQSTHALCLECTQVQNGSTHYVFKDSHGEKSYKQGKHYRTIDEVKQKVEYFTDIWFDFQYITASDISESIVMKRLDPVVFGEKILPKTLYTNDDIPECGVDWALRELNKYYDQKSGPQNEPNIAQAWNLLATSQLFSTSQSAPSSWSQRVLYQRGYVKIGGSLYTKVQCYEKAVSLNPKDAGTWNNFGDIGGGTVKEDIGGGTVKEVRYNSADCFIKALSLNPKNAAVWVNLGKVGGGKVEGTDYSEVECFKKALEVDPDNKDAKVAKEKQEELDNGKADRLEKKKEELQHNNKLIAGAFGGLALELGIMLYQAYHEEIKTMLSQSSDKFMQTLHTFA